MMPTCSWKRCRKVADYIIDLKVDDMDAPLCKKHFTKLMKLTNQRCEDE